MQKEIDEKAPKQLNRQSKGLIETFAIEDIEASPIGGALHASHLGQDFEDDYKSLFYNH